PEGVFQSARVYRDLGSWVECCVDAPERNPGGLGRNSGHAAGLWSGRGEGPSKATGAVVAREKESWQRARPGACCSGARWGHVADQCDGTVGKEHGAAQ